MILHERVDRVFEGPLVTIYDYRCDGAEPRRLFPETALDEPCVLFPRQGVFLKHEGRRAVVGDPNHVLFFDAHAPFRISYPEGGGDISTFFLVRPEILGEVLEGYAPRSAARRRTRFPVPRIASDPALYLFHRMLLRGAASPDTFDSLSIEECVVHLVAEAVASSLRLGRRERGAVRTATRRAHRESAEDVKTILGERYRENLSLAALARAVHSSPYHLSRVFKRETGIPIHRYRTRLRLRASLERVMDPSTSLTDLALELGFSSHSHFTDAFRREFGVSPSRLRESETLKGLVRHSRQHVA